MPDFNLPDNKERHELLLLERKTLFVLIAVSFLTLLIYFFGTDARELFTNLVNPLPEHEAFNGTTYPIKNIPDWVSLTEAERKAPYEQIPESKLMDMPYYSPARLATDMTSLEWNNTAHDAIRNEKITYSVPYLGNYKLDGYEYVGSHAAVDIKAPDGTPIYAMANGVVSKAADLTSGFGSHVVILHRDFPSLENQNEKVTLYSAYAHLSKILVSEREVVKKGQLIGFVGHSGVATTSHLHFQMDRDTVAWHPYWPFTSSEASAAGLSFFEAINAGLGKNRGLENTVHPMDYVQRYLSQGALIASTTTPSTSTPVTTTGSTVMKDAKLLIEPQGGSFTEGTDISLKISFIDSSGAVITTPEFDDRVSLELLNSRGTLERKFLTSGFFLGGSTEVAIQSTQVGNETVVARFNGNAFASPSFDILPKSTEVHPSADETGVVTAIVSQTVEEEKPLIVSSTPTNRGERIVLELQKQKFTVGVSNEFLFYYYDETDALRNPDPGIIAMEAIGISGTFEPSALSSLRFVDGVAHFTFTPEALSDMWGVKVMFKNMTVSTPPLIVEAPVVDTPETAVTDVTNAAETNIAAEVVFSDILKSS
ncbi:MAG: M23 family metallopeptidase, partial [Patescibacteria group bacterium]